MKWPFFLTFCTSLYAQTTLPSLIESALKNDRIQETLQRTRAADLNLEATRRSYLPRIDAFGNAAFVDHTSGFDARESYTAGAKAELTVFDGFKRSHRLDEKRSLREAAFFETEESKKQTSLQIIASYIELENLQDTIQSTLVMKQRVQEQLIRLEKFRSAGLASEDTLLRLKAEVADVSYTLEDLDYQSRKVKSDLELLSSQTIDTLEPSRIQEPLLQPLQPSDLLKAKESNRNASLALAMQATSGYLPTIKLEDTYTYYDYRHDSAPFPRVDHQNQVLATLQINLIDFSLASTQKEAMMAQAQAQNSDIAFTKKEQSEAYQLARRSIDRSRSLILNATASYDAAIKTYEAIKRKFDAGIVDHVVYLDALHTLRDSEYRLSRATRRLSYDYATFYYHAGLDPKDFVQ